MKTSKPFSTISYNSEAFLKATLQRLVDSRKIDFYTFVYHYPEADEKKPHRHVYIVPNGQIDTDQVRDLLIEVDPSNPLEKPLGCMPMRKSRFDDWYLYALHDVAYLASKGQSREHHYTREDFVSSDEDFLTEEIHTIDRTKFGKFEELRKAVDARISFAEFVKTGIVPIQQIYAYEKAYYIILEDATNRGGRDGHEGVDAITGEVAE